MPLWGQRLKRQVPEATYLELSPSGHCPHDEGGAEAFNYAAAAWLVSRRDGQPFPLACGQSRTIGGVTLSSIDGSPRIPPEMLDAMLWRARQALTGGGGRATAAS